MLKVGRASRRRGAALVLLMFVIIPLLAFAALAVDLGLLAVARTQCQQAADSAAMTGTRTLNGDMENNSNYDAVEPNVYASAGNNSILSKPVDGAQVTLRIGRYTYNKDAERFEGQFPGPSNENWSMTDVQVTANVVQQLAFASVFNLSSANVKAEATSAHRPRDISVIVDFSGSMRFASLMATPYSGNRTSSNNSDTVVPAFSHYSSSSANLTSSSFTMPYAEANISTMTADNRPPVVASFYQDSTGTPAFNPAPSSYGSTPAGDLPLRTNLNSSSTYAATASAALNIGSTGNGTKDAEFEQHGYRAPKLNGNQPLANIPAFNGYTQGPGYWGKTFFIWPPDPVNDWRKLYFHYPGNPSQRMDDNSRLWDSSGNWRAPGSSTYAIDYAAILNFIKNVGPNPFPSRLQSGRILYYDSIPDTINTGSFPPTNMNQRFWKDYIDYCLGLVQTSSSAWTVIQGGTGTSSGAGGYGQDFTWGTIRITAKSSLTTSGNPPTAPYMHYLDNPKRPKLHFWFGPLSMVDAMGNYNLWSVVSPTSSRFCWWPGTCHESPMYACKLGIRAALLDIKTNHPNDLVSLAYFSAPMTGANDTAGRRFNRVRVGLGRDYDRMVEALWYPPSTIGNANATVRPYSNDNLEVPRAMGGTCYAMPLMLAYNQFSNNAVLLNYNGGEPSGDAGGNGRRGAQKIIIFETDGAPNVTAQATLVNAGANKSYYRVRYNSANPGASEYPTGVTTYANNHGTVTAQIFNLCNQICQEDTASPPGYSSGSKKVNIHCIGFGPVFEVGSPDRAGAIATLNQMQQIGNINDGMPSYKLITGDEATMISDMQRAFTHILQNGIQVSLIR